MKKEFTRRMKLTFFLLLTALLSGILAGCGSSDVVEGTPPVVSFNGTEIIVGESVPSVLEDFELTFPGGFNVTGSLPGRSWLSSFLVVKQGTTSYGYLYIYNPEQNDTKYVSSIIYQVKFGMGSDDLANHWADENVLVNGIDFKGMNLDDVKAAMQGIAEYKESEYSFEDFNDGDYRYRFYFDDNGLVDEVTVELKIQKSYSEIK